MHTPNEGVFATVREMRREHGLQADPNLDDWLYFDRFDCTLRDQVNLKVLTERLDAEGGHTVLVECGNGRTDLLFDPGADIQVLAYELSEQMFVTGFLDEDRYWTVVTPIIHAAWRAADLPLRLEYIEAAYSLVATPEDALSDIPPEDVFDEIQRQLDI